MPISRTLVGMKFEVMYDPLIRISIGKSWSGSSSFPFFTDMLVHVAFYVASSHSASEIPLFPQVLVSEVVGNHMIYLIVI